MAIWAVPQAQAGGSLKPIDRGADSSSEAFAVVELFTAQGCGACPAADRLLGELAAEARKTGRRLFALAYHVDYFDARVPDPFSNPAFGDRQELYSEILGGDIYTPQMFVNGQAGFIGSERVTAVRTIATALTRSSSDEVKVKLEVDQSKARSGVNGLMGPVTVRSQVAGAPKGTELHVAIVEREASTAGHGRTGLRHENVVRAFKTLSLEKRQQHNLEIRLPAGMDPANTSVIAFVQDRKDLTISGAAGYDLKTTPVNKVASR